MKYAWIDAQRRKFPLPDMCEVLAVSISGYRAWRRGGKPDRTCLTDPQAVVLIKSIHAEEKAAYGSRRMHRELQGRGQRIGLRRVERLMRDNGIRARHKRRFKATTDSRHSMPVAPNVLARSFTPDAPNRVWTGDITYIQTGEGWLYCKRPPSTRIEIQDSVWLSHWLISATSNAAGSNGRPIHSLSSSCSGWAGSASASRKSS